MLELKGIWTRVVSLLFIIIFLGIIDWYTGHEFNFFVFYFLPVALAAWYFGPIGAISLSVISAIVWFFSDFYAGHIFLSSWHAVWNTMIRLISFIVIGWSVFRYKNLLDQERKNSEILRKSLSEIKILESYLSICAQCKKIRNKQGQWEQLETYISQHSDTQFSHGFCPDCSRKALEDAGLINNKG